jgi:hypothetical protein
MKCSMYLKKKIGVECSTIYLNLYFSDHCMSGSQDGRQWAMTLHIHQIEL